MRNDYLSKWILFITSYLPLYLWLLFSSIDYDKLDCSQFELRNLIEFSSFFRLVLVFLIFLSVVEIAKLFIGSRSEVKVLPVDMEVSPESDSLMSYVVTYFSPLISFDLQDMKSVVMNVLLFC